jgi:origin recognition complex subunit 4
VVDDDDDDEVEDEDDDFKDEEEDEDDAEMEVDVPSPEFAPRSVTRTRSRRSTARPRYNKKVSDEPKEKSPSPEYQDGLDDLVAMQLQQDLHENQPGTQEAVEVSEPLPEYAEKFQALCQSGLRDEVRLLSTILLEKLSGKRQVPLRGLEPEYQKVHQLVESTVSVGEGNSMLLLGSRGCGKTAIVESIISSLAKEHRNDFHVVRLNGFLHTDDRLALREMWRQLGRETHTEDDAAKVSSYADTMATLLAMLSHPEELFGTSGGGGATAAKSIVILLDEFDLFVTHPRQTLLYNLFDIAQARKAPIAVIGLTTKVDVTEMLEKRVKSRFSHRYVYVPLPRSFEIFSDACLGSLDLNDSEMADIADELGTERSLVESDKWKTLLEGWKEYLKVRSTTLRQHSNSLTCTLEIKHMWNDKDLQFHLKRIYNQTKSTKEFFTSALLPISDLLQSVSTADAHTTPQIPTPKTFASQTLSCPDPAPLPFSTSITSSSPSSLPLALLVAATRLAALFDPGNDGSQSMTPLALSFPAAYAEYVRLLTSAKTNASVGGAAATPGRVWGRDVARESWEKLLSWGLVTPVGSGNGTADGQMFRVEISFEEVIEMAGSGGALGQWWRE